MKRLTPTPSVPEGKEADREGYSEQRISYILKEKVDLQPTNP